MKWLRNIHDPNKGELLPPQFMPPEMVAEANKKWFAMMRDKVFGKPQATDDYHTAEELEALGYVGVYEPEEGEE